MTVRFAKGGPPSTNKWFRALMQQCPIMILVMKRLDVSGFSGAAAVMTDFSSMPPVLCDSANGGPSDRQNWAGLTIEG